MKLILNYISPPCRAVCMLVQALKLNNVHYEEVDILSKRNYHEKLAKINPQHTVPILQDDEFTIWDSHAISTYIVSKNGMEEKWYPKDIKQRALIDQRLHFDTGMLYPALSDAIRPVLFHGKNGITWSDAHRIRKCYSFMEKFLEGSAWLCGNHVTLADLSCLSTVSTLDLLYPVNENNYPKLARFLHKAEELPYYNQVNIHGLEKLCEEIHTRLARPPTDHDESSLSIEDNNSYTEPTSPTTQLHTP